MARKGEHRKNGPDDVESGQPHGRTTIHLHTAWLTWRLRLTGCGIRTGREDGATIFPAMAVQGWKEE